MFAQSELAKGERLTQLLGVVIAQNGGTISFKDQLTYLLPENMTVVEEYEEETDEIILRTVTPKKPQPELVGSPDVVMVVDEPTRVEFGVNGEAPVVTTDAAV